MTSYFLLPAITLGQREIVRFFRAPSRVIGALGTPLVFWLLIGSVFGMKVDTGAAEEMSYLEYFLPGVLLLNILFTSAFTMISVIEDKAEGFLLSAMVAPVSRAALVAGKVFGGAILATVQALVFLVIAPLAGLPMGWREALILSTVLFVISLGLTGFGFLFAWKMESTQGFHGIINLVLIPLWFLSGALHPMSQGSPWVQWATRLNPLSYANAALRHGFYLDAPSVAGLADFRTSLVVLATFTGAVMVAAFLMASRPLKQPLG